MRVLVAKFLDEPAVAIAVLAAAGFVALEHFTGDGFTSSDIPTLLAFPAVGGAIRQLVSPKETP